MATPRLVGADDEHGRPSSSEGRLEQHLGAVESVDAPATGTNPAIPAVSVLGYPLDARITATESMASSSSAAEAAGAAAPPGAAAAPESIQNRIAADSPGRVGAAKIHLTGESSRVLKGRGGGSESNGVSRVHDAPEKQRATEPLGQGGDGERRPRGKKGGRRRSASDIPVGPAPVAEANKVAAGGRGKVDGGARAQPCRTGSQTLVGSVVPDSGGVDGDGGGDRRGSGGEDRAGGRGRKGTADHKFRMQAGQSNTLVAVRLRPLLKHDREQVEVAKVRVFTAYTCILIVHVRNEWHKGQNGLLV